jgi:recombination protein RecA
MQGGLVELSVVGSGALATTFALAACVSAQKHPTLQGGLPAWCAFIDPSCTLYAPGVAAAGVLLERLLVVRPSVEALARTAVRIVESRAFALVVVDTFGALGAELGVKLGTWPRVVRRLTLSLEGLKSTVLLITDAAARRPLPLPVAQRIELAHPQRDMVSLRVVKDRYGRIGPERVIQWPPSNTSPQGSRLRKSDHASLSLVQHAS